MADSVRFYSTNVPVERSLAEVCGERLCITRAGIDELRTREVAP